MPETTERIARIESAVDYIQQLLQSEVRHIDEIMEFHRATHDREHALYQEAVRSASQALEGRLGEFRHSIEQFNTVLATVATRETIEGKFEANAIVVGHLNDDIASLREQIVAINATRRQHEKNSALWLPAATTIAAIIVSVIVSIFF